MRRLQLPCGLPAAEQTLARTRDEPATTPAKPVGHAALEAIAPGRFGRVNSVCISPLASGAETSE